jgi:hypothetical protein
MNYSQHVFTNLLLFVSSSPRGMVRGEVRGEMSNSNMFLPLC